MKQERTDTTTYRETAASPGNSSRNGVPYASILESLVIAAILLVLLQTFLEDFSVIAGWTIILRQKILIAGFFFDLFFTIEFLVRFYLAIMDRRVGRYLTLERGWIDFLASVPLLMFNSGPFALTLLTGRGVAIGLGGILNLLKVIKAIRIARILRFLRIIKIFRRIKNVSSPMAQRHVASITAISVTVLVFSLLFFSLFSTSLNLEGLDTAYSEGQRRIVSYLSTKKDDPVSFVAALDTLKSTDSSLLLVKHGGRTVYSRYSNGYYEKSFGPGDYSYFEKGELEFFFDQRPAVRQLARESILFFVIVVLVVLAYLLIYSPHFALTVSDPIHVMRKGLVEADYNLEVKIPSRYEEDDVFRLAAVYNEQYLTLKDRTQSQEGQGLLKLDMDDVSKMLQDEES